MFEREREVYIGLSDFTKNNYLFVAVPHQLSSQKEYDIELDANFIMVIQFEIENKFFFFDRFRYEVIILVTSPRVHL